MSLPNNTRTRLLSFGIVLCLILTVGGGGTALGDDDLHAASTLPVSISLAPSNQLAMPTSCLPDNNEPNDNPGQATPLGSSAVLASFHTPGDVDWYRYSASAGTWHSSYMDGVFIAYLLEVYNESTGQLVTSGIPYKNVASSSGLVQYYNSASWYAPVAGAYLVKVAYPVQANGLHTCSSSKYGINGRARPEFSVGGSYQVTGLVYHDSNWSGDWQIDEPPIESVAVRLLRPGGEVVATESSDSDGVFRFIDVAPGAYTVEQSDLSGYVSTTTNRVIVSLFHDTVVYFGDYYLPSRGSLQFLPMQLKQ
ncbi:MAG TPA: SdrD B-like domain-containing protein [Anaerolineae bacterium]|nr:SdrD B-like domain-containing protein [Anaerolineae bacterium]